MLPDQCFSYNSTLTVAIKRKYQSERRIDKENIGEFVRMARLKRAKYD